MEKYNNDIAEQSTAVDGHSNKMYLSHIIKKGPSGGT